MLHCARAASLCAPVAPPLNLRDAAPQATLRVKGDYKNENANMWDQIAYRIKFVEVRRPPSGPPAAPPPADTLRPRQALRLQHVLYPTAHVQA